MLGTTVRNGRVMIICKKDIFLSSSYDEFSGFIGNSAIVKKGGKTTAIPKEEIYMIFIEGNIIYPTKN